MTRKEYIVAISKCDIDSDIISQIESVYGCSLPVAIKRMLSCSGESVFFDDGYRTLSVAEILDAEKDLHVDFGALRMIPVIDCGENDFIVYHTAEGNWSKFNIIEECVFKKRATLGELL